MALILHPQDFFFTFFLGFLRPPKEKGSPFRYLFKTTAPPKFNAGFFCFLARFASFDYSESEQFLFSVRPVFVSYLYEHSFFPSGFPGRMHPRF